MKKLVLIVLLLAMAGIAGIVRSHTKGGGSVWPLRVNRDNQSASKAREEIRKSYELSSGARVEVSGINGWVRIETSDRKTADVYIERTAASQEALDRRKITIEATANGLTIRGGRGETGFLSRLFGANPIEHVTLQLPKQISLVTSGVNGSVTAGGVTGSVEVSGVNGRVELAQASGSATINGINGNISVGLDKIGKGGVDLNGINGDIELQLSDDASARLTTNGMNGRVTSEIPNVEVDKSNYGSYSAQIGKGEASISASGINGNIRLTRMSRAPAA